MKFKIPPRALLNILSARARRGWYYFLLAESSRDELLPMSFDEFMIAHAQGEKNV